MLRSRSLSHPRPSHSGAGFDFRNGGGFYKGNALAGFTNAPGYSGYYKPNQVVPPTPPSKAAKDIAINFTMVDFHGSVNVYDIWQSKALGAFEGSFTVRAPTAWPIRIFAEGAFANAGQGGAVPRERLPAPLARVG